MQHHSIVGFLFTNFRIVRVGMVFLLELKRQWPKRYCEKKPVDSVAAISFNQFVFASVIMHVACLMFMQNVSIGIRVLMKAAKCKAFLYTRTKNSTRHVIGVSIAYGPRRGWTILFSSYSFLTWFNTTTVNSHIYRLAYLLNYWHTWNESVQDHWTRMVWMVRSELAPIYVTTYRISFCLEFSIRANSKWTSKIHNQYDLYTLYANRSTTLPPQYRKPKKWCLMNKMSVKFKRFRCVNGNRAFASFCNIFNLN